MREHPRSLEEVLNQPPSRELQPEVNTQDTDKEKQPPAIESNKEKGILVRIGERVKEYAPSVMTGAAMGALIETVNYSFNLLDNRIIQFLTDNPTLRLIFEHPMVGDSSDKAMWAVIGAGVGALGFGAKQWVENRRSDIGGNNN